MNESTAVSPTRSTSYGGVVIFGMVALTGVGAVSAALYAMQLSVEDAGATPFVLAAMWVPALARLVAMSTSSVDGIRRFP